MMASYEKVCCVINFMKQLSDFNTGGIVTKKYVHPIRLLDCIKFTTN
jgi:hypothetical protein